MIKKSGPGQFFNSSPRKPAMYHSSHSPPFTKVAPLQAWRVMNTSERRWRTGLRKLQHQHVPPM